VAEHDTWISVDPVLGCPAACDYCYLGRRGLRTSRPLARISAAEMIVDLAEYLGERTDATPVAIGNYTDMAMTPANREYLVEFSERFAVAFPDRPLVVITKSPRIRDVADSLAATRHPILVFVSYSFSQHSGTPLESGPVADLDGALSSIAELARHRNLHPVHYWRPFLAKLNPIAELPGRVGLLADAGATSSVVVGFKSSQIGTQWWSPTTIGLLTEADSAGTGDERLPIELWRAVRDAAGSRCYAVYRNASCAIANVRRAPDALRTFEGRESAQHCRSANCPAEQRSVCAELAARPVTSKAVVAALSLLPCSGSKPADYSVEGGHVTVHGALTESQVNLVTHVSSLRVRSDRVVQEKEWVNHDRQSVEDVVSR